jgi:excisionase family DNA binding protein
MFRAGTPHGGEIAFVFGTLGTPSFGPPPPPPDAAGSGGLSDGAKLLGQLRQERRSEWCGIARLAALRSEQGFDLRFPSGRHGRRTSGSLESVSRAAHLLGISVKTLRDWIQGRRIDYVKVGTRVMIRPETIRQFVTSNTRRAAG